MKYEGLSQRESGMTVNGLGPFIFGDTVGIFIVLKCFPGAKSQFISVCLWWEVVCCTAPHCLTSVGQGVVVVCVTDDIPLRICVCMCTCVRAVQQDAFSCPELCFFFSCKSCYL
jgi:hypothetical protein